MVNELMLGEDGCIGVGRCIDCLKYFLFKSKLK